MHFCILYHVTYKEFWDNICPDTVFCVWLNTSGLEANAEENHPFFKDKRAWCQIMWLSHIILQYVRKRNGDTKHTYMYLLKLAYYFKLCIVYGSF